MKKSYRDYIHQLEDGRWFVAHWSNEHSQWQALHTDSERERMGYDGSPKFWFGPNLDRLSASSPIPSYAHYSSALRRAKILYSSEVEFS